MEKIIIFDKDTDIPKDATGYIIKLDECSEPLSPSMVLTQINKGRNIGEERIIELADVDFDPFSDISQNATVYVQEKAQVPYEAQKEYLELYRENNGNLSIIADILEEKNNNL